MGYRIGIDVGGTFTDFVLARPEGELLLLKVPTTVDDQSRGVMEGITQLASQEGLEARTLLASTKLIVHGTTIADNTMIEMNGALCGLITTAGHRDTIDIRRGYKESIWDPTLPPPIPIAPRRRRFGVPERLDFRGEVVTPLDEAATREALRRLRKQNVESIAVCLLFSFLNSAHEKRILELIREECPDARVSLSHEVMPAAAELERTSTTLVDAYVAPRVEGYLRRLERTLREGGYPGDLLIMQSNGGVQLADRLARRAVGALGSGPAGGVNGACVVAEEAGIRDFIAIDMGGTSYEVCLVRGGKPGMASDFNWQHRYLVSLPMVEIHSIGAGGGSIATVEDGVLKVGPRSARAEPGPISYGRGGTECTVTDANLLLGFLNPDALCGGDFKLRHEGVAEAILDQVGRPLKLDAVQAAEGIFKIVNANMSDAIRRVTCEAGLDPRDFELVAYGGNGPVHAGKQAEELGIRRILVPKTSPAFSALGLLVADFVVDRQRSYLTPSGAADSAHINELFAQLEAEAETELEPTGLAKDAMEFESILHVCYAGQAFDMAVPACMTDGRLAPGDLERTIARFHDLHEEMHTYAERSEEPMIRAVRLKVRGVTEKPPLPAPSRPTTPLESARKGTRAVYFDGAFGDTPVYDGDKIGPGHRLFGPAIIEERFTTIVLYPGHEAHVDAQGNYRIKIG